MPLHIYGLREEILLLQAEYNHTLNTLRQVGKTTPVVVVVAEINKEETTMVNHISIHPVSGRLVHVDLIRVDKNIPVEVEVPVRLINTVTAPVSRGSGAIISQEAYNIKIKALPFATPKFIEIDCSMLSKISDTILARDINLSENVELVSIPSIRMLSIQMSRAARSATGSAS